MGNQNDNFSKKNINTKWADTIEERKKLYKDWGTDKIIDQKKENWWLECFENPTDENIRLAKEFYKFWCKHGVLPYDLGVDEFRNCFARANAHWSEPIGKDVNGETIFQEVLLSEKDII